MISSMNRRVLIGGGDLAMVAAAAPSLSAAANLVRLENVSAGFAALITEADEKRALLDWHHRHVVEPASGMARHKAEIEANNALGDAYADAEWAVAAHPVSSAIDLNAKMAFIVASRMHESGDWHQAIAADVRRIVAAEGH